MGPYEAADLWLFRIPGSERTVGKNTEKFTLYEDGVHRNGRTCQTTVQISAPEITEMKCSTPDGVSSN